MKTLGIRVAPKKITFVVFDSDEQNIVNVEGIVVPRAMETPEQLKYVRNTVLDIIREYGVVRAGIRIAETVARGVPVERYALEGVIQEAFASSQLQGYFCGQIASIAKKMNLKREVLKKHLEGETEYEPIQGWMEHSKEEREAIAAALGAANA
ncbi:hypothetical protein [Caballeronia sp. INDeC2]|uniref:hypothetical protein n=1 Tax=Caballeronia sp. INDeC2 TaxID=2921747 RepID=UPI0020280D48|nr:hypothetical protein [Caballeronia sp. INDeC2]